MKLEQKKRNEIEQQFKWNVTDLFESDTAWQQSFDEIMGDALNFSKYKGNLKSSEMLLECLKKFDDINERASRVYVYANMRLHEDSAQTFYQGLADKAEGLVTKLSAVTAFIQPEILELDESKIYSWIENEKGLAIYKHFFNDLFRLKQHILTPELEELLAETGEMGAAFDNIYSMLSNADMKFGTVVDEDGNEVELTHGRYSSFLESRNKEIRRNAFNTMYDAYIKQKNTISTIYSSSVKKDAFYARARKFNSSLECSLSSNNIPVSVYKNLIATVREYLGEMHRYVKIRKKLLNLPELNMYDLYTPIVQEADTKINYSDAKATVLKALKPLGDEYVKQVAIGFESGWIDVYENEGKRSGAYAWGAYGSHPFVLLNYDNKINDMFTIAHEMGHAMHSHYSWGTQPFVYSGHTIFLAEVASTVNEALLMDYLLKTTEDQIQHKYLLNYFLEQFKGTVFRQTMFAEFEMITHELAESGTPLDVDLICKIYSDLNKQYYGEEIAYDDKIPMEWARIPHFYNAFYVFQYATGFSAAIALSRKILQNGKPAVDDYINFLKGGSSDYSIELLKKGGVDMTTTEPIRAALDVFKGLLDKF